MTTDYPPLPEPYDGMIDISGSGEMLDGFTADQMHAYIEADRANVESDRKARAAAEPTDDDLIKVARRHATAHVRDSVLLDFTRDVLALRAPAASVEPGATVAPSPACASCRDVQNLTVSCAICGRPGRAPAASVVPEPTAVRDDFEPKDMALIVQALLHMSNNKDRDSETRNRAYAMAQVLRSERAALSGVAQAKDSNVRTDRTVVAGSGSSHSGAAAVASSGRVEQAKDGT